MSVSIKYPFTQYAKLLHNLGLKFVESERSWIGYGLKRSVLEQKVPDDIKGWVSDFISFHDSLVSLKQKTGTIIDKSAQDPKYVKWEQLTEEDSLNACYRAEAESELRKQILLQIKMDFSHPKIRIEQGGHGLSKENGYFYIKGSLYTYHREGLNSLFGELCNFITLPETKIKSGNLELKWSKTPTTFQGTLHQLKIISLTNTLCDYYQVPRIDREKYSLEAMVDYPDSELFFNAHMHLVAKFSPYTLEDEMEDKISYKWFTEKEGLSHEEAERQVKYIASQILHRKHKIQVLSAFFETKLANKYTIEHIKFMFKQQLPYLD